MAFLDSHMDDAACAEVWTERTTSGASERGRRAEAHLRQCADCRAQYAAFSNWLDALRSEAIAEADEAFGADRLVAQHAQIMRRLEAMEQPGRVLTFPRFAHPTSVRPREGRHWVAAAAAAGLVAGLGLGQMLEFGGVTFRSTGGADVPAQQVAGGSGVEPSRIALQPVSAMVSDEAYLYEPDAVSSQARVPESLQYLNAITPSARDYDPR